MEIKIGVWKIVLEEKNNHYILDRVWCNDKEVDATGINIDFKRGGVPEITVYSRGRIEDPSLSKTEVEG